MGEPLDVGVPFAPGTFRAYSRPTGLSPWHVASRLERALFITVALVRGRARGVGGEFLQAMAIRFASRERATPSQIGVGTGFFPGGVGLDRLPRLIGRARAMELIMGLDI